MQIACRHIVTVHGHNAGAIGEHSLPASVTDDLGTGTGNGKSPEHLRADGDETPRRSKLQQPLDGAASAIVGNRQSQQTSTDETEVASSHGGYVNAVRAAPTIPASLRILAGTTRVSVRLKCLKNFLCFLLAPPPTMIRSGQTRRSMQ